MPETVEIKCGVCGDVKESKSTAKGLTRLPRSWKRHQNRTWCDVCWKKYFVLRAITIPVAGPVDAEWSDLREALNQCWKLSTGISNWIVTELVKADVVRVPEMEKLPPMPKVYLYSSSTPAAIKHREQGTSVIPKSGLIETFPDVDSRAAVSLMQSVERKYRSWRYHVLWLRKSRLPTYTYPTPYPVHNAGWQASIGADGEPLVTVTLAGTRWTLRLRGGKDFRRQLRDHRQIANGEAVQGELAVYPKEVSVSSHRAGMESPNGADGNDKQQRVMVKMVAWMPRTDRVSDGQVMMVRTRPDALLVASFRGRPRDWWYNAGHIRRLIAEQDAENERLRQDTKAERRRSRERHRGPRARMGKQSKKFGERMNAFLEDVSAHLVRFADRQRAATIVYDDTERTYFTHFPWYRLGMLIEQKANAAGIAFETYESRKTRLERESLTDELAALNLALTSLLKGKDDDDDDDDSQ